MLYLRRTKGSTRNRKEVLFMDLALTNFSSPGLQVLEDIKKAVINEKKFLVNEDILEDFSKSLRQVADATRETYLKGARHFVAYCLENNIEEVAEEDITKYVNCLYSSYSASTINMYLTALRKFYKFLNKKGIKNLASDIESIRNSRNPKKDPLTKDQALELLSSIDRTTEEGLRNYALVNLLLRQGLRTIELERANVGDLRTLGTKHLLQVQRKGHHEKDDYIKLRPATYEAILDYLATRKDAKANDPLFTSLSNRDKGSRLKTRTIRHIVKGLLLNIGINSPRITSHSLRHSAITFALLGGASIQEAQLLAGHENINTTLIYAHNLDKLNTDYEEHIDNYLES